MAMKVMRFLLAGSNDRVSRAYEIKLNTYLNRSCTVVAVAHIIRNVFMNCMKAGVKMYRFGQLARLGNRRLFTLKIKIIFISRIMTV